jgi:hypothetical protein
VSLLCEAVRPYHADGAPVLRYQHGAGDIAYLGAIPGVEFGCAGGNPHGSHEYLDIDSLQPYGKTLLAHVGLIADTRHQLGRGLGLPATRLRGGLDSHANCGETRTASAEFVAGYG